MQLISWSEKIIEYNIENVYGLLVNWVIRIKKVADLVNKILDKVAKALSPDEYSIVHTDWGYQYPWMG